MATNVAAPSLQRTNSNGNLNVYLIVKNKTNDDLLILSREHLSPALRTGRLILNQKIIFHDEERRTREGTIIYMRKCSTVLSYIYFNISVLTIDHDRDNCIIKKEELLETGHLQSQERNTRKSSNITNVRDSRACASKIIIQNKFAQKFMDKSSKTPNRSKGTESDENSMLLTTQSSVYESCDNEEDDDYAASGSIEYYLSSTKEKSSLNNDVYPNMDDMMDTSCKFENDANNVYMERIKGLTDKVIQQARALKQRNTEIKRLQSTTIGKGYH